jgi:hypothetical protein
MQAVFLAAVLSCLLDLGVWGLASLPRASPRPWRGIIGREQFLGFSPTVKYAGLLALSFLVVMAAVGIGRWARGRWTAWCLALPIAGYALGGHSVEALWLTALGLAAWARGIGNTGALGWYRRALAPEPLIVGQAALSLSLFYFLDFRLPRFDVPAL